MTKKTHLVKKPDLRSPIKLEPDSAVNAILNTVLSTVSQTPSITLAIGAFCEGRRLKGSWRLHITGVELVPDEPTELTKG